MAPFLGVRKLVLFLAALALLAFATAAARAEPADVGRGRLLYQNTCETCHTEQVHWRAKSLVHDWPSLIFQVARWQKNAGQEWGAEEVRDVASFLNRLIYRMPCPVPGCSPDERVGLLLPDNAAGQPQ